MDYGGHPHTCIPEFRDFSQYLRKNYWMFLLLLFCYFWGFRVFDFGPYGQRGRKLGTTACFYSKSKKKLFTIGRLRLPK